MTKVYDVAADFICGATNRCGNAHTDGKTYVLHRSVICQRNLDDSLRFDWCGYYTSTTARHMNAILQAHGAGMKVGYAKARDERQTSFEVR